MADMRFSRYLTSQLIIYQRPNRESSSIWPRRAGRAELRQDADEDDAQAALHLGQADITQVGMQERREFAVSHRARRGITRH
jgi:hypothetical protein